MGNTCNQDVVNCTAHDEEIPAQHTQTRSFSSEKSGTSFHTDSLFFLQERNPKEMYGDQIESLGKFGAVREFFQGTVCPDCCWCAFALANGSRTYMTNAQLHEFFQTVLHFFKQTTSPTLQLWSKRKSNDIYYEFVIKTFGKAKTHLNRREFWYIADKMHSKFETERTSSTREAEKFTIGWHRKQTLIAPFFLNESDFARGNEVIFKLFSSDKSVLTNDEMHDLVYHSIIFFSSQQCALLQDLTDVWDVVFEVCRDIMGGKPFTEVSFVRFEKAAKELRNVFEQLCSLQEERFSNMESTIKSSSLDRSETFESSRRGLYVDRRKSVML